MSMRWPACVPDSICRPVVAEYRALRASVIRLWREMAPNPDRLDLEDSTRFSESIDQSLTEAVRSYTTMVDRSRQMFLAILGHDLRNPLNSVIMSAALLTRTAKLDADSSELVGEIAAIATAMADMIRDLLDFTATELGVALPLAPAAMDLRHLCQAVVSEMKAAYPTRIVALTVDGDLTGEWDAARLRQVLSNLLGNAINMGPGRSSLP